MQIIADLEGLDEINHQANVLISLAALFEKALSFDLL